MVVHQLPNQLGIKGLAEPGVSDGSLRKHGEKKDTEGVGRSGTSHLKRTRDFGSFRTIYHALELTLTPSCSSSSAACNPCCTELP